MVLIRQYKAASKVVAVDSEATHVFTVYQWLKDGIARGRGQCIAYDFGFVKHVFGHIVFTGKLARCVDHSLASYDRTYICRPSPSTLKQ